MASRNQIDILKITPNADFPKNTGQSNVYEIAVTARTDNRAEDAALDTNNFHTGLQFKIPPGYYVELSAHPNLYKFGYTFEGPFVLDQNSSAELIITLIKFKENAGDLDLPVSVARMVAKRYVDVIFCAVHKKKPQVTDEEIEMPTYERGTQPKLATNKSTKKKNTSFF